jgi:hypothetical protein
MVSHFDRISRSVLRVICSQKGYENGAIIFRKDVSLVRH